MVFVASPPAALTAKYNNAPTWITPSGSLGAANGGIAYTFNFQASDEENDAITYTLISGTLPTGISLSGNQLTGTPVNNPATYSFTISISDGNFSVNRNFTLDITNDTPIWNTAAGALGSLDQNTSGTYTLSATDLNGDTITYSISAGSLPSGMTLSGNVISGTPTTSGTSNFTITASDDKGGSVNRAFSITVNSVGDAYWTNVIYAHHYDGTNGNVPSLDILNNSTTVSGTVTLSNTQSKFGGSSVYCNGSSYLNVSCVPIQSIGNVFTVEAWIYPTANGLNKKFISTRVGNTSGWDLIFNNDSFGFNGYGSHTTPGAHYTSASYPINQWYHIAWATTVIK